MQLPYISNENISSWTGKLLKEKQMMVESEGRIFKANDVLFNKLLPRLAKVYHANFDGISSGELLALRSSENLSSRFLFHFLSSKAFIDAVNAETFGTTMLRTDWETVSHQPLPLPSFKVQCRVADFLDEKTTQIDGLVEKKRDLLNRLAEKRQTLITQAVTKGLDPSVPVKASGIDWLGDIPMHWRIKPVKRVAKLESGHTPDKKSDKYWEDCTTPWVSLNDTATLRHNDYISETMFNVNEKGIQNSSARLLPAQAVVFTRDATIGESAITTVPMAVSQHIIAWLCDTSEVIPEYLLFVIYGMQGELRRITNCTTIGTISMQDVRGIRVAIPPTEEQLSIIEYVQDGKARIEAASQEIETSIEKLIEYRSALVTAAVTGKLGT